jgi:hypothetical protein
VQLKDRVHIIYHREYGNYVLNSVFGLQPLQVNEMNSGAIVDSHWKEPADNKKDQLCKQLCPQIGVERLHYA